MPWLVFVSLNLKLKDIATLVINILLERKCSKEPENKFRKHAVWLKKTKIGIPKEQQHEIKTKMNLLKKRCERKEKLEILQWTFVFNWTKVQKPEKKNCVWVCVERSSKRLLYKQTIIVRHLAEYRNHNFHVVLHDELTDQFDGKLKEMLSKKGTIFELFSNEKEQERKHQKCQI